MAKIFVTDRDGSAHVLEAQGQATLMEILRQAGLSVEALCGGSCQCATCHVFIDPDWLGKLHAQTDFEVAALECEGSAMQAGSRLSCQIKWRDELDGIVLTVAPGV